MDQKYFHAFSGKRINMVLITLGIFLLCIVISALVTSLYLNRGLLDILNYYLVSTVFSPAGILSVLRRTTYLLIIGLGLAIAIKCSMGNIGAEGQMAIGALTTAGICVFLNLPPVVLIIMAFALSLLLGGLWASIAGFLKMKWGIDEMIITVMQNFIALSLLLYLAGGPWKAPFALVEITPYINQGTQFPFLAYPLNTVFLIAVALVPAIYFFINKTQLGSELKAVGYNKTVSFSVGINVNRIIVLSMFLSGAICALAGTSMVVGEFFYVQRGITASYGFFGIIVALLVDAKPEMMPISAFLVAIVLSGGTALTVLGAPARLGEAIMGFLFIGVAARKILARRN
jgi:simple sugar transport system permease protein